MQRGQGLATGPVSIVGHGDVHRPLVQRTQKQVGHWSDWLFPHRALFNR